MEKALQENNVITDELIEKYREILVCDEKSKHTIEKYIRDARKLQKFLSGRELNKEMLIEYKAQLEENGGYKVSSINSFLSVANNFCKMMEGYELHINTIRVQQQAFTTEDKEITVNEYRKLVMKAWEQGNERLALIIQTIAGTGIRISELVYVTAESLMKGAADVYNKGKVRSIIYPKELIKVLKKYAKEQGIKSGSIFLTRTGNPVDRSNVWREMHNLCEEAKVPQGKVFPHNLRHLFARCFYNIKKDIALLADVLGHSNLATTRIYIRTTAKEHQKLLDMMNMIIENRREKCKRGKKKRAKHGGCKR